MTHLLKDNIHYLSEKLGFKISPSKKSIHLTLGGETPLVILLEVEEKSLHLSSLICDFVPKTKSEISSFFKAYLGDLLTKPKTEGRMVAKEDEIILKKEIPFENLLNPCDLFEEILHFAQLGQKWRKKAYEIDSNRTKAPSQPQELLLFNSLNF